MSIEEKKKEFVPLSIPKVSFNLVNALDVIAKSKKMSRSKLMILALEEFALNNFSNSNQKSMFD